MFTIAIALGKKVDALQRIPLLHIVPFPGFVSGKALSTPALAEL